MTDKLEILDAYVDGRLDDDEVAAFERQLVSQPDLRTEVERQQQINETLRRIVRPPSREHLQAIADNEVRTVAPRGRRPWTPLRRFGIAAAVAAGVFGGWQIWRVVPTSPADTYQRQPWRSFATVYHDWVAEGFEPAWVCADDREFAESFRSVLGHGLVLAELPPDTEALGLSYCHSLTPQTTCLLAEVEGHKVVVFVDRLERDTAQPGPGTEGLNLFRRELGGLVLYEMTPLEEPALLGWFNQSDGDS